MNHRHRLARSVLVLALLLAFIMPAPASASTRYIVRDRLGLLNLRTVCSLLGCNVLYGIGDPLGQLFVINTPDSLNQVLFLARILLLPGIVSIEPDRNLKVAAANAGAVPPALYDEQPVSYYGTTVWNGYVDQPATQIIRLADAQKKFNVTGAGTVAIIDTGIDPNHPVLKSVLVAGYDFTRNARSGSEMGDVTQSTAAVLDGANPAFVNQSTAAVLDQSTAAVLDDTKYAAFGHGTMVAGIVHLVAPKAKIMPLKAFRADGSGYTSDILRAVYYATKNGARVLNMSFSLSSPSPELENAIDYSTSRSVIAVASAGNDGQQILVYPAALSNVMGVGSTTNYDTLSSFSNYGPNLVWVGAPGEGVVTTYPYGTYAAAWGTSFSTPFVSGSAALLLQLSAANESQAADAVGHARWISDELGHGRLDVYQAVQAWRAAIATR